MHPPCARPSLRINLPFVNIERDLTTHGEAGALATSRSIKMDAATTYYVGDWSGFCERDTLYADYGGRGTRRYAREAPATATTENGRQIGDL